MDLAKENITMDVTSKTKSQSECSNNLAAQPTQGGLLPETTFNISETMTGIDFSTIKPIDIQTLNINDLLNSSSHTYQINTVALPNTGSYNQGNYSNTVWTTAGTGATTSWGDIKIQDQLSSKISVNGPDADIDINGRSLTAWMDKIEDRLNMLTPNPELEKEWDELRRLGERYRKLEEKCKQKANMWEKLKAMPPPKVS